MQRYLIATATGILVLTLGGCAVTPIDENSNRNHRHDGWNKNGWDKKDWKNDRDHDRRNWDRNRDRDRSHWDRKHDRDGRHDDHHDHDD